jgi:hypothetical protein
MNPLEYGVIEAVRKYDNAVDTVRRGFSQAVGYIRNSPVGVLYGTVLGAVEGYSLSRVLMAKKKAKRKPKKKEDHSGKTGEHKARRKSGWVPKGGNPKDNSETKVNKNELKKKKK